MKVAVKNLSKKELKIIRNNTISRIREHIKKRKGCDKISLAVALKIPFTFFEYNVVCMECGHVEEMAAYAIAQKAMGNRITFACDCGNKIPL